MMENDTTLATLAPIIKAGGAVPERCFPLAHVHFPCSADHEQDWQPYPVDPYSAICDDHTYIHTHTHSLSLVTPI